MSRRQLAQYLHIPEGTFSSAFARKSKKTFSVETIEKMAKILSVPIYDLIAPELSINYSVDAETGELKKEERIQKTILLFVDAIKEREYNEQFAAMKSYFDKLNATGRDKAVEQICILTHVPEYCSQEDDMNGKL